MAALYLSRLTLDRDAPEAALAPLLDPEDRARALDAHHRLLWTAFADAPDRRRDFLWRAEGGGRFYVLSARPPRAGGLFRPPEVKEFAPALGAGDRLDFVLRANATRDRPRGERDPDNPRKDRRVDVVMDALRSTPPGEERRAARFATAERAAGAWMERQAVAHGFAIDTLRLDDYSAVPLPRPGRRGPRSRDPKLGILDMAGTLTVRDPAAFLARLGQGFGRARAFGCGLMLIRRASRA